MPRKGRSGFDLGAALKDAAQRTAQAIQSGQPAQSAQPARASSPEASAFQPEKTAASDAESGGGARPREVPLTVQRGKKGNPSVRTWFQVGFALLALVTLYKSWVLVGAGERAVVFNRFSGVEYGQLGEGLHFVMPWVQDPTLYDIKSQTYTMSGSANESNSQAGSANDALEALTKDGLPVNLEMSVRFHPDPDKVWELHQNVGPDYVAKVVRSDIRAHTRMVVAQYAVIDVYGARRAQLVEQINARLRRLFAQNDLVLDEALLRDVSFSPAFQNSIEQKQVAQQEVARMTFVLEAARKEKQRKIIAAQGEAESIRLKANALARNPGLTQYEYVQNLPTHVKTVVTDGRTIVNLGQMDDASAAAAADDAPPRTTPNAMPTAESAANEDEPATP